MFVWMPYKAALFSNLKAISSAHNLQCLYLFQRDQGLIRTKNARLNMFPGLLIRSMFPLVNFLAIPRRFYGPDCQYSTRIRNSRESTLILC